MREDSAGAVVVSAASEDDLPAIERIAETVFTTGRFLLDPHLYRSLNGRRYRHWVCNSFGNPGHRVLKAELDGALAGFFIVEERRDGPRTGI